MWLLIAEALIALGLLVLVVWWTIGTRRRSDVDLEVPPAALPPPADGPPADAVAPDPPPGPDRPA